MPKAEVGSTKYLNNKLKSKGLQRLRWYCQVCERQMRDENGFKCHTSSESHVRQMLVVGENSAKYINDYSGQFQRDFMQLLRTSHGEKKVNMNHFYQEYIHNKEHIHMNATHFQSLTEFGKHLGREGLCRVEEGEKGLEIAWIDNSPEALRRQDAIRRKERQDKGDEEREQKLIAEQVERARRDADIKFVTDRDEMRSLQRDDGDKITINFESSGKQMPSPPSSDRKGKSPDPAIVQSADKTKATWQSRHSSSEKTSLLTTAGTAGPVALKLGTSKPKNIFGSGGKKNVLGVPKPAPKIATQKPMSEAERIMKQELERKRAREGGARDQPQKKIRI